jgi:hypothetical protein
MSLSQKTRAWVLELNRLTELNYAGNERSEGKAASSTPTAAKATSVGGQEPVKERVVPKARQTSAGTARHKAAKQNDPDPG